MENNYTSLDSISILQTCDPTLKATLHLRRPVKTVFVQNTKHGNSGITSMPQKFQSIGKSKDLRHKVVDQCDILFQNWDEMSLTSCY